MGNAPGREEERWREVVEEGRPARSRARSLSPKVVTAALAAALALAVSELALRAVAPGTFHVWTPGLTQTFDPDPAVVPGVTGPSRFRINSEGMRADEPTARQAHRILALGGSTTECLFLDGPEAWPRLLQDGLGAPGRPVVVGNVGKSGQRTRQHVLQVERLLPQHPGFRTVILLAGLNDLQWALQVDVHAREPIGPQDYARAFMVFPSHAVVPATAPFYAKTRLYALLTRRDRVEVPVTALVQDVHGQFYRAYRERRRLAPRRAAPRDLAQALAEYRRDLRAVADAAARSSARLVLVTQPTLWRADLPPELEALTWFGWSSTNEYYTTAALAEAMDRYNRALLEVCRERGLECVDLAARLPRDATVFYDDVHFNEAGARQVAAVLAEHFRARPPLAR